MKIKIIAILLIFCVYVAIGTYMEKANLNNAYIIAIVLAQFLILSCVAISKIAMIHIRQIEYEIARINREVNNAQTKDEQALAECELLKREMCELIRGIIKNKKVIHIVVGERYGRDVV